MGQPLLKDVNFSTFWTSCFYSPERRFSIVKYGKRHFSGLYSLKKKVGKMAIFRRKPWVIPFGKKFNFSAFWTSGFYTLERRFFVLEYRKRHFSCRYWLKKKKLKKWPFFGQNHGLTPLKKCQFLDFLNFWFLYPRKAIFCSRIL